ncbi:hypothetical protein [Flavobacterium capsici]|uniref:Uncharacterized protein n=1 Tax=Flavobacterium capsici TaxID=3075618 RepID=A0AA96EWE8_9FLAO|nr:MULTISPECIES: hypothetical protein [unclassified Flavobacterium]WNM18137.1 hypothetical protein RN608_08935 [Flavobacterium sp. PMR2A8]WNM22189.1 hypothetical protein RN605_02235 [Flavobacterium sp. PMTSA4]
MARQNLISAGTDDTTIENAITGIKTVKDLFPFLLNLSAEERKRFRKMGPKSVDYVNDNLAAGNQFPSSLPSDFPLSEFGKDVQLINKLYPLLVASQALTEGLNDTILALGSDAMKEADEVYNYLKLAAKKDANAKEMVIQIGKRFKGQGKKKPE